MSYQRCFNTIVDMHRASRRLNSASSAVVLCIVGLICSWVLASELGAQDDTRYSVPAVRATRLTATNRVGKSIRATSDASVPVHGRAVYYSNRTRANPSFFGNRYPEYQAHVNRRLRPPRKTADGNRVVRYSAPARYSIRGCST